MAAGEIPADIGGDILDRIRARGKMTPDIYQAFIGQLAGRGLYNVMTTPFDRTPPPVDGTFRYECRNVFFFLFKGVIQAVYNTLGRLLARVTYGLKLKGRKHLKALKKTGVVTVSNHFSYLDILCNRCATGWRTMKFAVAPHNAGGKWTIGRWFFLGGGAVPIATNLAGARNFNATLEKAIKKGQLVHFYAERSMWLNYPHPRPMLPGAFTLAAKTGAPVVPIYYAYRKPGFLRRLLHMHAPMTGHICAPVYPDMTLAVKARAEQLCRAAEAAMRAIRY